MDRYGQYVKAPEGGVKEVRGKLPARAVKARRAAPAERASRTSAGDWAPEQVVMADPRGAGGGLVPLSTIADAKPGERGRRRGARGAAGRPPGRGSTAAPS